MKKDMADRLFSVVLQRYREERPDVKLTPDMQDQIWFSLLGELQRNGYNAAYKYAITAELLYH